MSILAQPTLEDEVLLDASLHHSVLAGAVTGAGQVALKDQWRLNLIEFL